MNSTADPSSSFESATSQWIHLVGVGIEIFGVFIIVAGIIWSARYIFERNVASRYDSYKISIGRSLFFLVLVRTFLSWTLTLEIEGRWPWQPGRASMDRAQGREEHSSS